MEIGSGLNIVRALPMFRMLTPRACFEILEGAMIKGVLHILEIHVTGIALEPENGPDKSILPLGELVKIKGAREIH